MNRNIDFLLRFLICPDCSSELQKRVDYAQCLSCGRMYEIFNNNLINILPSHKFKREGGSYVERRSIEIYNRLFKEPWTMKEDPLPWGLNIPANYKKKLNKHKYLINKLVPDKMKFFCDISAGSGRFSWEIARMSDMAVLCDLSVDAAIYLSRKAINEKLNNIFILRCDYFQPPFKQNNFDFALCNDTLIYGLTHEARLLSSIYSLLKIKGKAVLDIPYKYHRGFWHKPYTFAYSKKEMENMLEGAGFYINNYLPLYHELSYDLEELRFSSKLLKLMLPPTRYIYTVVK